MQPEDKNQQQTESSEEIASSSASKPETVSGLDVIHCPKCNSTRIRKHSGIMWFPVGIAGMLLILSGQYIIVLLPFNRYIFIISYLLVFILYAACVFIWVLLFRYSRCKNCGHRFPKRHGVLRGQDHIAFPFKFFLLNGLLFLLGALTTAGMLEDLLFNNTANYQIRAFWLGIFCVFFVFFSLIYHLVAYLILQKVRIRNQFLWAIVFVIPVILLRGHDLPYDSHEVRAASILTYGRLADLPESATDLKVYSWSSPFSGEWYLKFKASSEDIDEFIKNSPSLKDQECIKYSPEKMRLLTPRDREKRMEYEQTGHKLFYPRSLSPKWYRPEIRVHGREYEVPPLAERRHNWGEVIVDDDQNIVYIKIIWS